MSALPNGGAGLARFQYELLGLAAGAVLGVALLVFWQPAPPDPGVLASAETALRVTTMRVEALQQRPSYIGIAESWRLVSARFDACGVQRRLLAPGEIEDLYAGPVLAWHGALTGGAPQVIACVLTLPAFAPVRLNSVTVKAGAAALSYSVLGTPSQALSQSQ